MKTIIAGSRNITNYDTVLDVLGEAAFSITEVVSGGARGVDSVGERIATEFNIPIVRFLPEWDKYGKSAGFIRNKEMAEYAEALIAVWDGHSAGTRNMINTAKRLGLKVHIGMV